MKKMRRRVTAFVLILVLLFTTGCSSGFYADELPQTGTDNVSGNNVETKENVDLQVESLQDTSYDESEDVVDSDIVLSDKDVDYGYYDEYGQYHFDSSVDESIEKWIADYISSSDSYGLDLSDDWWGNLTEEEYVLAESLISPTDVDPYSYTNQTLDDCINLLLSNEVDEEYLFYGTVFEGVSLSDLEYLKEKGYSLDDLSLVIAELLYGSDDTVFDEDSLKRVEILVTDDYLVDIALKSKICTGEYENSGISMYAFPTEEGSTAHTYTAEASAINTGYITMKDEPVWRITLGGKPAICLNHGMKCRSGYVYTSTGIPASYSKPLGFYIAMTKGGSKEMAAAAQIAAWAYLGQVSHVGSGGRNITKEQMDRAVASVMPAYKNGEDVVKHMQTQVWSIYKRGLSANSNYKFYVWTSKNDSAQRLITCEIPPDIVYPDENPDPPGGGGGGSEQPEFPITPPDTPVETPELEDIYGFYACETTLSTTINTIKRDIETAKPLEGVGFSVFGDFGGDYITDANGSFSPTNSDSFAEAASWYVSSGSHEVKVGEDSHGNDIKETKYYYTCKECGQSGDYDSESSMKEAGEQHCVNHSRDIAEAALDADVAAYKFTWGVKEVYPRTSEHTNSLITGGTDSYTTGYHNNPVITQSNTESGYHRDEHRVINVNLTNERVRGTITINKSDMDYLNCRTEGDNNQDFIPQGDASLAGAVYGLYANADIIRPDGKSGVDRTGLPTNIRMDYCTGSVDDPNAHKTYSGVNPFGIDAIHTTTPLPVPIQQVNYNYTDGTVYHKGDLVAVGMFDTNLIKGTFQ